MASDSKPLECLLLADDLTGACDAAVHFAMRGRRTAAAVSIDSAAGEAEVWAVNTESRDLDSAGIEHRIAQVQLTLPAGPSTLIFKKIDSTLRGNAGMETVAALEAFACELALFTPALPAVGRTVENGVLRVAGSACAPIELAGWLRAQGVKTCAHARPGTVAEAAASGARLIALDAVSDSDLDAIVRESMALQCRLLWVGSAGLAAALARALPALSPHVQPTPRPTGPVLFGMGSTHAATLAQRQALAAARPVACLTSSQACPESIANALAGGSHVWLDIPRGQVPEERVADLIAGAPAAALALSGGDTASLVCRALRAKRIELVEEIVPGIPHGTLRGGGRDGMPVVTKSGGFGAPDALIQVADFFKCPKL